MRTLSAHMTPMDRQIQESLNILLEIRKEGSCLNQKSEWAGARIPNLEVRVLKGMARPRKEVENPEQENQGDKLEQQTGVRREERLRQQE